MCCKWKKLIKEADKEEIKKKLNEEKLYDMDIIDTLFSKELITKDEYIHYLKQIMNNHSDYARFLEMLISYVEKIDNYKPSLIGFSAQYFNNSKE